MQTQINCSTFGFYKVAVGSPLIRVANPTFNTEEIKKQVDVAITRGAGLLVTPELSVCGYTCGDLFGQAALIRGCEEAIADLVAYTAKSELFLVVGAPLKCGYRLFNCAVAINKGEILGVVPKEYLTAAEKAHFTRGSEAVEDTITLCGQRVPFGDMLFRLSNDLTVGIEIGSDLWAAIPPSSYMALGGANLILNLSASAEAVSAYEYRRQLVKMQSASAVCAYAMANAGVGESTTDLVFAGGGIIAENGDILAEGERFARNGVLTFSCVDLQRLSALRASDPAFADGSVLEPVDYPEVVGSVAALEEKHFTRYIDPHPFVPAGDEDKKQRCEEIFSIQAAGLAKRLEHTGLKKCVLGISGGLDSTLALLVSARALKMLGLGSENIIGITMPGFGTTDRTYNNALELMASLGVETREISIKEACITHLRDIGHDINNHDITYENAQARERTQILMDIANKEGGILVGTGDLSEIALGWCTYNADHMSMYGVNAGIPKTLVRHLVDYVAGKSGGKTGEILYDILDTPVSPELLPPDEAGNIAQKTEDKIGPYELHDFFLYHFVRLGEDKEKIAFLAEKAFGGSYSEETVDKWLTTFIRRFFISQFKRSCSPDGPKVGTVGLSPRGDWQMPSDADFSQWLK